ncbi:hypothetical protein DCAR_0104142 [Daucus carota subsp. sativus]|uniref:DUF4408 domain-containing protein n=2 Tax=Daucus carota subsp. sativus TaxID=79200 RepID=A0AAF0W9Y6_DAUCS|nr:hypothetical protein DCAR_0104142 [Daucus carota subsp. sativus]
MPALLHQNSQQNSLNQPKAFIQSIPFWVMFLSILIFIFKYYFFNDLNVSHSSFLSTTKFWFLVSNIIVLIIALDFGAFCSSSNDGLYKDHPNDDNYRHERENDLKYHTPALKIAETVHNEQVKDIVVYKETKSSTYNKADHQMKPIMISEKDDIVHQLGSKVDHKDVEKNDQEKKKAPPCRHLSMSDGDAAVALKDHKEKNTSVLYRSKTENFDMNAEDNEFSSMSNEELNRRVEEFIKRCNRQIRLEP